MRKLLVIIVFAICGIFFTSCGNVNNKPKNVKTEVLQDSDNFKIIRWTYKGHEYLTVCSGFTDSYYNTIHSQSCPCRNKKK